MKNLQINLIDCYQVIDDRLLLSAKAYI